MKKALLLIVYFLTPSLFLLILNRSFFSLFNPSWGDMTAMPTYPLPIENFFYLYNDAFNSGLGVTHVPHILFSQLNYFFSPTVSQYILLFSVFVFVQILFIDIIARLGIAEKRLSVTAFSYSSLLTLALAVSNVFIINYIQGSIDVYTSYLFAIPITAYLYILFIRPSVTICALIAFISIIASWYSQFSLVYITLFLLPYFIIFFFLRRVILLSLLRYLFVTVCLVLLLNGPTLHQIILKTGAAIHNVGNINAEEFVGNLTYMYARITMLNSFMFSGNNGDTSRIIYNVEERNLPPSNKFLALLILQCIPLAFWLLSIRNKKAYAPKAFYGFMTVFLLYAGFLVIYKLNFIQWFLENIYVAPLFRNPKKIILSVYGAFMLALLFAPYAFTIKRRSYLLSILFVILLHIGISYEFIFDGYMGLRTYTKKDINPTLLTDREFKNIYGFPDRYLSVKKNLNTTKIIIAPNNSQSLYANHIRYLYRPLLVSEGNSVWGSLEDPKDFNIALYQKLISGNIDSFARVMSSLGVRYLVIDKKAPWYLYTDDPTPTIRYFYGVYTSGNPALYEKLLQEQKSLKPIYRDANFIIYETIYAPQPLVSFPTTLCKQYQQLGNSCDAAIKFKDIQSLGKKAAITSNTIKSDAPTHITTTLRVDSPGEAILILNKLYSSSWHLTSDMPIKTTQPNIANGYTTYWKVDFPEKGTYHINIYYAQQRLFFILSVISLIGLLAVIILICI